VTVFSVRSKLLEEPSYQWSHGFAPWEARLPDVGLGGSLLYAQAEVLSEQEDVPKIVSPRSEFAYDEAGKDNPREVRWVRNH
jgi:hypothetical protein